MRKAEIGIGTLGLVVLAVIFIAILSYWATGDLIPGMSEKVDEAGDWINKIAQECANLDSINITRCAEGSCTISTNYTDTSTYSVKIPITTIYWLDVDLIRTRSGAENYNPEDDQRHICSNNDPNLFDPQDYQPLIYEFKISNFMREYTERYVVHPEDMHDNLRENVSIRLGTIPAGTYNLRWRIITDWDSSLDASCSGPARRGQIFSDIRLYCGGIEE